MIHQFPIQNKDPRITEDLPTAIFKAVLYALQTNLPDQRQPEQFAHEVIEIADEYEITPKALVDWITSQRGKKGVTAASFRRCAEAYDEYRSQRLAKAVKEQPGFCSNCGMPLQLSFCTSCGERHA